MAGEEPSSTPGGEFFVTFFVLITFGFCLVFCCCRKETVREHDIQGNNDLTNNTEGTQLTPEERRAIIEDTVITRKVIAASEGRKSSSMLESLGSGERAYSSFVAAFSQMSKSQRSIEFSELELSQQRSASLPTLSAPEIAKMKLDLEAAERGTSHPNLITTSSHVEDGKEIEQGGQSEEGQQGEKIANTSQLDRDEVLKGKEETALPSRSSSVRRRKSNLVARMISSSLRGYDEQPTTCDICLMDYEVGEDVCWSPNEQCLHVFHKECIVDWLLKNPNCPCCRRNYLEKTSREEGETAQA